MATQQKPATPRIQKRAAFSGGTMQLRAQKNWRNALQQNTRQKKRAQQKKQKSPTLFTPTFFHFVSGFLLIILASFVVAMLTGTSAASSGL